MTENDVRTDRDVHLFSTVTIHHGLTDVIKRYCQESKDKSAPKWFGMVQFTQGDSVEMQLAMVKYHPQPSRLPDSLKKNENSFLVFFSVPNENIRDKLRLTPQWSIMFDTSNHGYSESESAKSTTEGLAIHLDCGVGEMADFISNTLTKVYGLSDQEVQCVIFYTS